MNEIETRLLNLEQKMDNDILMPSNNQHVKSTKEYPDYITDEVESMVRQNLISYLKENQYSTINQKLLVVFENDNEWDSVFSKVKEKYESDKSSIINANKPFLETQLLNIFTIILMIIIIIIYRLLIKKHFMKTKVLFFCTMLANIFYSLISLFI